MDPLNQPQPTPAPAPQPPVAPVPPQPQMPQQPAVPPVAPYPVQGATPGKGLSIAGFVISLLSIFTNLFTLGIVAVVGLGLSIAGRVQSKKGGKPNGMALAGIIISSIVAAITIIVFVLGVIAGISYASQMNDKCKELGVGSHQIMIGDSSATLICTDSGFEVSTN